MFKTIWETMKEEPKVTKVDIKQPTMTEDCRVLSIPKLLEMSQGIDLSFDGFDEDVDALSDEMLELDDPRDDIADLFEKQQAIDSLKAQQSSNNENIKASAGDVPQQQSQADTISTDEVGN